MSRPLKVNIATSERSSGMALQTVLDKISKMSPPPCIRAFERTVKWAFKFRPVFSLLVLASAVMFTVLAVLNNRATTLSIVGVPEVVHIASHAQKHHRKLTSHQQQTVALEFVPLGTMNTSRNGANDQRTSSDHEEETEVPVLLTLFTTFKNRRDRWRIHWNILKNWSLFRPDVRLILFNDRTDPSLVHFARELNWSVLPVPAKNLYGTPLLKHMYFTSQKHVPNSMFYGYANGDILFDHGLVDTLKLIGAHLNTLMPSLIVGRRTNFRVKNRRITTLEEVSALARTEGKLFRSDAEDYFFLAHNEFPWKAVPSIVIGRPTYDNFLVATAVKYSVAVIDATQSLIALHQTGLDGDFAGHKNKDANYNARVIGNFDYSKGLTTTSQYVTKYSRDGRVLELWRRAGAGESAMLLTPVSPVTEPANTSNRTSQLPPEAKSNSSSYGGPTTTDNGTRTSYSSPGLVHDKHTKNNSKSSEIDYYRIGKETTSAPNSNFVVENHLINTSKSLASNETTLNETLLNDAPVDDLLTLFTIFNVHPGLRYIHLNVIKNWAFFHPNVATVLFTDSTDPALDATARKYNWTVLPKMEQIGKVLPFKRMFQKVQQTFPNSKFYGYLSGDLLFGEGLRRTVSVVYRALEDIDNALLVGVKNRYLISEQQYLCDPKEVDAIVRARAKHIHPDFDENLLLAHAQFPWQHIPDLVIGRSVYDNYLVALALRHEFAVVDATRTLIGLDQLTTDTTLVQNELEDFDPNLLGALDYTSGFASAAQYETKFDDRGDIRLWKRQKEGSKSPVVQAYLRK